MTGTSAWIKNIEALQQSAPSLVARLNCLAHVPADDGIRDVLKTKVKMASVYICLGIEAFVSLIEKLGLGGRKPGLIIVIERSLQNIASKISRHDVSEGLSNFEISWIVEEGDEKMSSLLHDKFTNDYIAASLWDVAYLEGHHSDQDDDYYAYARRVVAEHIFAAIEQRNSFSIDAHHGLINLLSNWRTFQTLPSVDGLRNKFTGVPGILIGAGPSLDRRISALMELQHKAILFCVDSAYPTLLKAGIRPHFVGIVERPACLYEYFVPQMNKDSEPDGHTLLLVAPFIAPEVISVHRGPVLTMIRDLGIMRWFYPDAHRFFPGASSSHQGLSFLNYIGCHPIVLMGNDLAYDAKSGLSHTEAMPFKHEAKEVSKKQSHLRNLMVKGNSGEEITSRSDWKLFITLFEKLIDSEKVDCINVIEENAGARIVGAKRIDPDDFAVGEGVLGLREMVDDACMKLGVDKMEDEFLDLTVEKLGEYATRCEAVWGAIFKMYRGEFAAIESGLVGDGVALFLAKVEEVAKQLQDDADEVYGSLLDHFTRAKLYNLTAESIKLLDEDILEPERIKKQFDLIADWFSTLSFWARQLIHTINHYRPK